MDKNRDIYIETPQDYNKLDNKKKGELDDALFLLHGNILREFFSDKKTIKTICDDKPDIRIEFTESNTKKIIGLEIVKCYPFQGMNCTQIRNDLYSICEDAIKELKEEYKNELNLSHKVIQVTIPHEVMVCGFNKIDKPKIIQELKTSITNVLFRNSSSISICSHKYISKLGIKENRYISDNKKYKIEICPTMAYIIPSIKQFANKPEKDPIAKCISKKRKRLIEYKQMNCNSDICEWWLGISIPNDAYFHIWGYQLPKYVNIKTELNDNPVYDRIFLISKTSYNPNVCQIFPSVGTI